MNALWFAPLLVLTLFAVVSAMLPGGVFTPAAWAHLVLALGVMPLILAATAHFTPVLSRGAPPPRWVRPLPAVALLAAVPLIGFLQKGWPLLWPAALGALVVVTAQAGWMVRRARAAFGAPHPGLAWYLAAFACLALALAAVAAAPLVPEQWGALRRLHLHFNLLGFVGLTALGTLWVLLPTVAGYAEPAAGDRLRRDLPPLLAATAASAVGAAWWWPLSLVGGALWLYGLGRFLAPLLGHHRHAVWGAPGPARALALAALGLVLNLMTGVAHGLGGWPPASVALFVFAFLLPLVSGAAAHLVPLWRWPGPATPRREAARRRLGHGHGLRGALFIACGVTVAAGVPEAAWLAALGLAQFILQALWALIAPEKSLD